MANVPFSALYNQILPYLPGAEIPIVDLQIRKATREFMKRTTVVQEKFTFDTTADSPIYQFNPTFGEVASMMRVWIRDEHGNERELGNVLEERRRPLDPPGKPVGWYTTLPHLLTLQPCPDAAYTITCAAALTLSQTDTQLPEELVRQYAEALAAGVVAAMCSMPGKPWTHADTAKNSGRIYSRVISTIRAAQRDGGRPNQSTFTGIARFGA